MAVSSLFGAAASFFYAMSALLNGGVQNHAAGVQRTFVHNSFESEPSPTHFASRASFFSASSLNSSAIPASSTNYSVKFASISPNLAFRPAFSTYNLYGSESTINVSAIPPVDFAKLFPDLAASIRAGSGRMMQGSQVGISYYDGETIATVFVNANGNVSHCDLLEVNHPEEQVAALKKLALENKIIEKIGFHGMLNLIRACQLLDVKNNVSENIVDGSGVGGTENDVGDGATQEPINPIDILVGRNKNNNMWSMVSGILPGTKWCGLKDIAKGYNDLGPIRDLDKCCRSHDLCPRKVLAFRSAYGLVNWSLVSKSHCECDTALYDCLKRASVSNPTAELVGNFYFNVLRVQCIDEENPPKCVENDGYNCIKWENDNSDNLRLVFREVRRRFR